jgi:HK97 family phage prohead protease
MNGIEYKSIGSELMLKDIDEKQGRILGYFSKFGNIDSDKDMIMPGAFTKTLKENHSRIKHLYQHDPLKPLAGVKNGRLVITEEKEGLAFDSTISQTSYGRDVIKLYSDGVIDEHSIGFNTVRKSEKQGYVQIEEIKLWEGSTVTWGANEFAGTTSVKSLSKEDAIKKMGVVIKALRNGSYENEDIFDLLDIYFKQLQQIILDIKTTEPVVETTLPVLDTLKTFTNSLISK